MPGWVWAVGGLALLGLELGLIDTGFYLVFLGVSAIVVGLSVMFVGPASVSLQWLLYGAISVVSLVGFRGKVYARIRRNTAADLPEGTTGEWALASERIEAGATGRVELRGTHWSARNVGSSAIEKGVRAQVVRAESLLLFIQAESH
jgi:inner membrane protein